MTFDITRLETGSIDTAIVDIDRLPEDKVQLSRVVRHVGRILMFHRLPNPKQGADYFQDHRFEKRCPTAVYRLVYDQGGCSDSYEDIQVYSNETFVSAVWEYRRGTPLIDYAMKVREHCGVKMREIVEVAGNSGITHFFSKTQFGVPTKKQYDALIARFNLDQMDGFLTHDELVAEDEKYLAKHQGLLHPDYILPPGKKAARNVLEHDTKDEAVEYLAKLFTKRGGQVLVMAGTEPDRVFTNEGWNILL